MSYANEIVMRNLVLTLGVFVAPIFKAIHHEPVPSWSPYFIIYLLIFCCYFWNMVGQET